MSSITPATFPTRVTDLARRDKLVYTHWASALNGSTGAFTGRDYRALAPFGPVGGFADAQQAASFVRDVATGATTDHGVSLANGGIIGAAIVKEGSSYFPLQLAGSLVGAPGRAHKGALVSTLMTANADTTFNYAGEERPLPTGEKSFTPWGFRNYASEVSNLVVADSTGAVADVRHEGRAHWWNTPKTGVFGF